MSLWFLICVIGTIAVVPIHFLSVEHIKLDRRYGEKQGKKVGAILGMISGWGYFIFLIGMWVTPQERFLIDSNTLMVFPILNIDIGLINLLIAVPIIIIGAYLGIVGVKGTGIEVSETHRAEFIATDGIYSKTRHPQYLGAVLSHIGMSFFFAAFYALLATTLVIVATYLTARKEEQELIREFGEEYREYKSRVRMFI